jgi:hypothetical protein
MAHLRNWKVLTKDLEEGLFWPVLGKIDDHTQDPG